MTRQGLERGDERPNVRFDTSAAARWNRLTLPYLVERQGVDLAKPAIVFEESKRTYGQLRDRSRRVANGLLGLGVERMDRVALLTTNRLEFLEIEIGIAAARAIMVPLNWRLRPGEIATLLRRAGVRTIFVEERFLPTVVELRRSGEVPELRTVIALGDGGASDLEYEELCASSSPERPPLAGALDDAHEIIFTSGTTGQPKGVVWSNGTVLFNAVQADHRLPARPAALDLRDRRPLLHRWPA